MAKSPDSPKVFGWVEKSTLVPWGVELKTKLDSGALTSSLHATDVESFEKDGDDWVRFTVNVEDQHTGKKVEKNLREASLPQGHHSWCRRHRAPGGCADEGVHG